VEYNYGYSAAHIVYNNEVTTFNPSPEVLKVERKICNIGV
jgi:hypothetical protein